MEAKNSPFPCYWWGSSLEIVGLESIRPFVSTYGRYDFSALPPIPFQLHGDLEWLENTKSHILNIGCEREKENKIALQELVQSCDAVDIQLPASFLKFMSNFSLQERVRSNTDCYLFLCPSPIPSPKGGGYLLRFLSDSQACLFWYIYITEDRSDHAVVCSPGFYGIKSELWREEEPDPDEINFCAESFEIFLWRFWIENEIWLLANDNLPLPDIGLAYVEKYKANHAYRLIGGSMDKEESR
jgi:hypothetical protein